METIKLIGFDKILPSKQALNMLNIVGLQRDENTYSDILYYILKSEEGNSFITSILDNINIEYPEEIKKEKMEILREYHRFDLTILFNKIEFIICIENKIDAEERDNQISDYQAILQKYYGDYSGIFLFLTPEGREPSTLDIRSKFKCYTISYREIITALNVIKKNENINNFINNFIETIKGNITMDTKTVNAINEFWGKKSNRDKLKCLNDNRPRILDIKERLHKEVDRYLKDRGDELKSCEGYRNKELHLRVKSLNNKNLPVIFLFYDDETKENTPSLRIALYCDDFYSIPKSRIKEYEKNDSLSFEKIKGWGGYWYALYTGKSLEADFTVNEDHDYGDKLINILFEEFKKQYEKIVEIVKNTPI